MSTERKDLTVDVRITPYSGGSNEDHGGFTIVLEDTTSGLRVAEVELTYKQFGELMANRQVTAPAEVWVSENHGWRREVMQLSVPLDSYAWPGSGASAGAVESAAGLRRDAYRKALVDAGYAREFGIGQNNGWMASDDKTYNFHRRTEDGYLVTFTRYVDAEETTS